MKHEPGSIQAFAVTERHLKFYDRATGRRAATKPATGAWR
jgi:hypothetical protein